MAASLSATAYHESIAYGGRLPYLVTNDKILFSELNKLYSYLIFLSIARANERSELGTRYPVLALESGRGRGQMKSDA